MNETPTETQHEYEEKYDVIKTIKYETIQTPGQGEV